MDINNVTLGVILTGIGALFLFKKLIDEMLVPFIRRKMNIENNTKKVTEIPKIVERINEQDMRIEDQGKQIENIARLQKKQFDILDDLQNKSNVADKLIIGAMVAILDNQITGNGVENLKIIKNKLMEYLTVH